MRKLYKGQFPKDNTDLAILREKLSEDICNSIHGGVKTFMVQGDDLFCVLVADYLNFYKKRIPYHNFTSEVCVGLSNSIHQENYDVILHASLTDDWEKTANEVVVY